MGYGDLIMAAGQAQEIYNQDPSLGPVAIVSSTGKVRWRDIWAGNPAIFVPAPGAPRPPRSVLTGRGHLPYLDNERSSGTQWVWSPTWRACDHRGSIYLTDTERAWADQSPLSRLLPYILVEPTAPRKHVNRRPPALFWTDLVVALRRRLSRHALVQLDHPEALRVPGLIPIPNANFRDACAVLAGATALITTEGGLAHAAAALNVPAIILWGGNISMPHLGYPEHANLVPDDGEHAACGRLTACAECALLWQDLPPEAVLAAISTYTPAGGTRTDGFSGSRQ
jgi:hypothetical protein